MGLIDHTVIDRIVHGFPTVARVIEDAPPEKWPLALDAVAENAAAKHHHAVHRRGNRNRPRFLTID